MSDGADLDGGKGKLRNTLMWIAWDTERMPPPIRSTDEELSKAAMDYHQKMVDERDRWKSVCASMEVALVSIASSRRPVGMSHDVYQEGLRLRAADALSVDLSPLREMLERAAGLGYDAGTDDRFPAPGEVKSDIAKRVMEGR